ncbi:MAG: hypothetical protein SVM80_07160 [Halobacteriota archaeon]|nr:hypothetical protein [Halobacteriota archaeon]
MNIKVPVTMAGVGIIMGVMLNIAFGYPPWEMGGIIGGMLTGILMWILGL